MTDDSANKDDATLPYGSAATFITTLDHLGAVGIPNMVDRNALPPSFSGSSRYETLGMLRFFGLIDKNGRPNTAALQPLIDPETRKDATIKLLETYYAGLFALPLSSAGPTEIQRWFTENATPSTAGKARAFFVSLAKQNAIPMHSMVAKGTRVMGGSVKRRRKKNGPKSSGSNGAADGAGIGDVDDRDEDSRSQGSSKTITLKGDAGTVTLSVSVDMMELEDDDHDFVRDLIGRLKAYEKNGGPPKA